jgi:4-hydroxy-4-methyl-2-oxoglutarate aldolase
VTPQTPPARTPAPTRTDGRDLGLIDRLAALHVAVVSDCLDQVGIRDNVMAPHIRPLTDDSKVAGYAATVQLIEVDSAPADSQDWYRGEIEAIEQMLPGDVLVGSTCPGSYWGELLATASRHYGVRGVIADAWTRDTVALRELGFPAFVAGIQAQDSLGRIDVQASNVPIECAGVAVNPGDLMIADQDGVAVIPEAVASDVIDRAEKKLKAEHDMRSELRDGLPLSAAFDKYRML